MIPLYIKRALNSSKLNGTIPASLGQLSALYWLDLADNQLTGTIPISRTREPGLDLLHHTKHFHFNKNQLSGQIPEQLFSDEEFKKFMGNLSIEAVIKLEKKRADRKLRELDSEVDSNPIVGFFKKRVRDSLQREKKRLEKVEETFKALDLNKVARCIVDTNEEEEHVKDMRMLLVTGKDMSLHPLGLVHLMWYLPVSRQQVQEYI